MSFSCFIRSIESNETIASIQWIREYRKRSTSFIVRPGPILSVFMWPKSFMPMLICNVLFSQITSKILPDIQITKAKVEHFDDLMPLFQHNAAYLKRTHGEFFLAELIESSNQDPRLMTLVGMSNDKPIAFCCFTVCTVYAHSNLCTLLFDVGKHRRMSIC